jgi:molybdopterin-guanine dinucleotide biosynthesis protein MobB
MKTLRYRGVPVIGFAAYSGSGKTTLMRKLIPCLIARGLRPAVVKHAHHDFDIDYPGKDSYELRKAGADQVIVGSAHRWAMVVETGGGHDPDLSEFLARLDVAEIDIILVEGFRDVPFPKIEIHRKALERRMFYPDDAYVIALASDDLDTHQGAITTVPLDPVNALADFIVAYAEQARNP